MKIENLNMKMTDERGGYKVQLMAVFDEEQKVRSVAQGYVSKVEGDGKTIAYFDVDAEGGVNYRFRTADMDTQKEVIEVVSGCVSEVKDAKWNVERVTV